MNSRSLRVGVAALLVVVGALTGSGPAGADEAKPWDFFHLEMGPAAENLSPYRIRISSGCEDEITYRYWVGRKGPDGSQWPGPEYDARGPQASGDTDFAPSSGTFALSKSKPVTLEVPLINDREHEGPEFVPILVESFTLAGAMVGNVSHCSEDHVTTNQFELAFTIEDDDPAPAASAAGSSGGSKSPPPAGANSKPGYAGGPTRGPGDSRPEVAIVDRASSDLDSADGVSLIGLDASSPGGRRKSEGGRGAWLSGIGLVFVGAVAVSLRRRSPSW